VRTPTETNKTVLPGILQLHKGTQLAPPRRFGA
jgi:hypothetical protein